MMRAQHHSSSSASPHYWASTFALCLCTLTHAYLLINVFPYSGYMAIKLLPSRANEENAGQFAGLLATSFMAGRAISSYQWGTWADAYGRTTVLIFSLALSSIFSLLFGTSQSFTAALVWRGLLGLSNGIIGTSKTLVSELAPGNEFLESRAMALVVGMRGWGFLMSPAIGGSLAQVVKQYPHSMWVHEHKAFLSKFPFLLPNIVGAVFCLLSIIAVKLCIKETLSQEKISDSLRASFYWWRRRVSHLSRINEEESKSFTSTSMTWYTPISSYEEEEDEEEEEEDDDDENNSTSDPNDDKVALATIWSRPYTRRHLIVYWVYSFVIISVDEAFPLYCISRGAGLALSEADIGKILSISGLLFVLAQYCCYTCLVDSFGIYGSIHAGTFTVIPAIAFIPASLWFQTTLGELNGSLLVYLSILMSIYRIFANIFFSSITIATNRTVPADCRASMNGLGMLGASICKALGPAMAGLFVAYAFSSGVFEPHVGAVVVFGVFALLALLVAVPAAMHLEPLWPSLPVVPNVNVHGGEARESNGGL